MQGNGSPFGACWAVDAEVSCECVGVLEFGTANGGDFVVPDERPVGVANRAFWVEKRGWTLLLNRRWNGMGFVIQQTDGKVQARPASILQAC